MNDQYDRLYAATAIVIQIILVLYFAVRTWDLAVAVRWGWIIYILALPAVLVSVVLLVGGKPWPMWIAGFLFAAWALFGYVVDIAQPIAWRSPIVWPVFLPYVLLYLAGLMFYWWPLATIQRPLWFVYAALFALSTTLNAASHRS